MGERLGVGERLGFVTANAGGRSVFEHRILELEIGALVSIPLTIGPDAADIARRAWPLLRGRPSSFEIALLLGTHLLLVLISRLVGRFRPGSGSGGTSINCRHNAVLEPTQTLICYCIGGGLSLVLALHGPILPLTELPCYAPQENRRFFLSHICLFLIVLEYKGDGPAGAGVSKQTRLPKEAKT